MREIETIQWEMNIPRANNSEKKKIIMDDNTSSNKMHLKIKKTSRKSLTMVRKDSSNIQQWWKYTYSKSKKKQKDNG